MLDIYVFMTNLRHHTLHISNEKIPVLLLWKFDEVCASLRILLTIKRFPLKHLRKQNLKSL